MKELSMWVNNNLTISLIILLMQHKLNIFHLHNLKGLEFKVEDSNEEDTSPTQVEPLPLPEEGVGRICPGLQLVKRVTYRERKGKRRLRGLCIKPELNALVVCLKLAVVMALLFYDNIILVLVQNKPHNHPRFNQKCHAYINQQYYINEQCIWFYVGMFKKPMEAIWMHANFCQRCLQILLMCCTTVK